MIITIIFWIVIPPSLIFFLALCKLISDYLNQKLPYLQTLLDLYIIDSAYVAASFQIFASMPFCIHFSPFQLDSVTAHVIMAFMRLFMTLLINYILGTLSQKAILLFKPHWIQLESDAHFYGRIVIGSVSAIMFIIDMIPFTEVDNPLNTGLSLLTGNPNERLVLNL